MTDTIPDHVGREAVRLLNEGMSAPNWFWPKDRNTAAVITVAKLLMNPPAPMTDPDEEARAMVPDVAALVDLITDAKSVLSDLLCEEEPGTGDPDDDPLVDILRRFTEALAPFTKG